MRNCDGTGKPYYISDIGIEVTKCPVKEVTAQSRIFLDAYSHYLSGYLPNSGGWADQSMRFDAAIKILQKAHAELLEKKKATNAKH